MQCYVFRVSGDLVYILPDTPDPAISVPAEETIRTVYPARQQAFYNALTEEDAQSFENFCRSRKKSGSAGAQAVPSLLLFPRNTFAAVFAERYTSRLLQSDPLPGAAGYALPPLTVRRMVETFHGHHLILSLLYQTLSELYDTTSPLLSGIPPLVKNILAELEKLHTPSPISDTLPCLKSYRSELYASDTPVFLDLVEILSRLSVWLPATPLFSSLDLNFQPPDITLLPELYQVRFSASAFLHIFVLLSYVLSVLSDDGTVDLSLYRRGTDACLTFHIETDRIPLGFSCRNELNSLSSCLSLYKGYLTLIQYLLHRSGIRFSCNTTMEKGWPSAEITLEMDTRFREEIEFRCGDTDDLLARILPDAISLLRLLTDDPPPDLLRPDRQKQT